jgi:hypothetical protein
VSDRWRYPGEKRGVRPGYVVSLRGDRFLTPDDCNANSSHGWSVVRRTRAGPCCILARPSISSARPGPVAGICLFFFANLHGHLPGTHRCVPSISQSDSGIHAHPSLHAPATSSIRGEEPPANQNSGPKEAAYPRIASRTQPNTPTQRPKENPRSCLPFILSIPHPLLPPRARAAVPTPALRSSLPGAAPTPSPPRRRLCSRVREALRPAHLPETHRRRRRSGGTAPPGPLAGR